MLGGGTMLRKDVPPYVMVNHNPVGYMGINSVGLQRRGFSKEQIDEIHDMYRVIYQSGRNTTQALEHIKELNLKPPGTRRSTGIYFRLKAWYNQVSNKIRKANDLRRTTKDLK